MTHERHVRHNIKYRCGASIRYYGFKIEKVTANNMRIT